MSMNTTNLAVQKHDSGAIFDLIAATLCNHY